MAYDVQFTGPARRALQKIPPRVAPAIIEFAFGDIYSRPGLDLKYREVAVIALRAAASDPVDALAYE